MMYIKQVHWKKGIVYLVDNFGAKYSQYLVLPDKSVKTKIT